MQYLNKCSIATYIELNTIDATNPPEVVVVAVVVRAATNKQKRRSRISEYFNSSSHYQFIALLKVIITNRACVPTVLLTDSADKKTTRLNGHSLPSLDPGQPKLNLR